MNEFETNSFAETLKDKIKECKTLDEKFDRIIDFFCSQTEMLDFILDSLPPNVQREVERKAGIDKISIL